jgi:hypothetical protein
MGGPELAPLIPEVPAATPNLEVAGFVLTPQTQEDLEKLDFSQLPPMSGKHVLALTRDNLPNDAKLIAALKNSGSELETEVGVGYAEMMNPPHESAAPVETIRTIINFLERASSNSAPSTNRRTVPAARVSFLEEAGAKESLVCLEHEGDSLFAIVSEPTRELAIDCCLLLLNPGAIRHIGANRMWVDAARRWAIRGVPSLRLDLKNIGESGGRGDRSNPSLYRDGIVEQIQSAMEYMRSRVGARHFAVAGLCSGAFGAFQTAIRDGAVRSAILINPQLFFWDPEVDRRRELRRIVSGLADSKDWRKLASRQISIGRLRKAGRAALSHIRARRESMKRSQIPEKLMARAWADLERFNTRVTFIFSQGEPLLFEMEDENQLPPSGNERIRLVRIATADHTIRPVWAQTMVHDIIDAEVDALCNEGQTLSARNPAS